MHLNVGLFGESYIKCIILVSGDNKQGTTIDLTIFMRQIC